MTKLHQLFEEQGQSPWLDNLKRAYLTGGELPRLVTDATRAAVEGDDESLLADDERARFVACLYGRHAIRIGSELELAVDTAHLHFFDPDTGDVLGDRGLAAAAR